MSAKADAWMPLYIGDYIADTMHLECAGHGAYLLLIMHYWRNGPLPDDDRALAAIARCERKVWAADIGPVVRQFFTPESGRLRHKRIDQEIQEAEAHVKAKSTAGKKGAEKRWQKDGTRMAEPSSANGTGMAVASQSHDFANAPSPSPSPSPSTSLRSGVPRVGYDDPDFARFWALYPRKDAKADALKAWIAATRSTPASEILAGLGRYRFDPNPTYQKLPAGWLRDERWLEQQTTPPPAAPPSSLPENLKPAELRWAQ